MTIVPIDLHGIAADSFHDDRLDVWPDLRSLDLPATRPFIDAFGATALKAHFRKWNDGRLPRVPHDAHFGFGLLLDAGRYRFHVHVVTYPERHGKTEPPGKGCPIAPALPVLYPG